MLFALAACGAACPVPGQRQQADARLFFGRAIPGGGSVPDAAWADFAASVLTAAFPDGFSVFEASGQWRNPADGRISRETTMVVEILGPVPAARLTSVANAYKARFHQQSVGIVTTTSCAVF